MFDFLKSDLKKPAPQQQPGGQQMNQPTDAEQAIQDARWQFIHDQALGFQRQIRMLKIGLIMAVEAGELPDEFRKHLFKELIQCAGFVEVSEVVK